MLIQGLEAFVQVVGVTGLFFWPAPLALKQGCLAGVCAEVADTGFGGFCAGGGRDGAHLLAGTAGAEAGLPGSGVRGGG